ncbi:Mannosyltransferase 1 CMT1 [Penicillium coprophilum]|uniref:Mannosyltransferase 1 CMT1 n=1 Tax=Penicillium coprophilum TaxID=36646 RepID=UPI002395A6CE|nr:Mannosyltransferase 1 CMT1 [Penicillium coprophilum]KAJ5165044.1 Mannosyltransferase 1 CMT1 [Penicillium coprophilum]
MEQRTSIQVKSLDFGNMVNFTIVNDNLQVAIDVSGNGKLPWPASTEPDSSTQFHDITLFLTSGSHNFTISNGTKPASNTSYVGPVLDLEPSSTVKHVNWIWPECLVGDGSGSKDSARGAYNISMHQSFRWNGTDYYTVFDLPISVTNSIPKDDDRVDCDLLENKLLSAAEIGESSDTLPGQPWVEGGASTTVSSPDATQTGTGSRSHLGFKRVAVLRYRIVRALIIIFAIWNLAEIHLIHHRIYKADYTALRRRPQKQERIYIASINWNNELILRSHWSKALKLLVLKLGPENVFISIYESGSYDNTKGALRELDWELERMRVPRNITLSPVTHEDEIAAPARGEGWIRTPDGKKQLRRIPYLARIRNLSLQPLRDLASKGITFDKILFLNDVVFTPNDVLRLLDTNDGEYGAACSLDFSKPPSFYDTFALRDSNGHEPIMQTWPYFTSAASRQGMRDMSAVPVASCWNGMVAMPASPFIAKSPLRFRGIPDSLASYHLEGSECCLIHIDNPLSVEKGVYLNPLVRVGYSGAANAAVHPMMNWLSTGRILRGLWVNRLRRFGISTWLKEKVVRMRVDRWRALSAGNEEYGEICIINEMQILHRYGWAHV